MGALGRALADPVVEPLAAHQEGAPDGGKGDHGNEGQRARQLRRQQTKGGEEQTGAGEPQ